LIIYKVIFLSTISFCYYFLFNM